jgi:hypothetical protein
MMNLKQAKGKSFIVYDDSPSKMYVVFYGHEYDRMSRYFPDFKDAMTFAKSQKSETQINLFPSGYYP